MFEDPDGDGNPPGSVSCLTLDNAGGTGVFCDRGSYCLPIWSCVRSIDGKPSGIILGNAACSPKKLSVGREIYGDVCDPSFDTEFRPPYTSSLILGGAARSYGKVVDGRESVPAGLEGGIM